MEVWPSTYRYANLKLVDHYSSRELTRLDAYARLQIFDILLY